MTQFIVCFDENKNNQRSYCTSRSPILYQATKLSSLFGSFEAEASRKIKDAQKSKNLFGSNLEDETKELSQTEELPQDSSVDEFFNKLDKEEKIMFSKIKPVVDRLIQQHYLTKTGEVKHNVKIDQNCAKYNQKLEALIYWTSCVNIKWMTDASKVKVINKLSNNCNVESLHYNEVMRVKKMSDALVCSDTINCEVTFNIWRKDIILKKETPIRAKNTIIPTVPQNQPLENNTNIKQTMPENVKATNIDGNNLKDNISDISSNVDIFDEPIDEIIDNNEISFVINSNPHLLDSLTPVQSNKQLSGPPTSLVQTKSIVLDTTTNLLYSNYLKAISNFIIDCLKCIINMSFLKRNDFKNLSVHNDCLEKSLNDKITADLSEIIEVWSQKQANMAGLDGSLQTRTKILADHYMLLRFRYFLDETETLYIFFTNFGVKLFYLFVG